MRLIIDKQGALESLRTAKDLEKRVAELKGTDKVASPAGKSKIASPIVPAVTTSRPSKVTEPQVLHLTHDAVLMEQRSIDYKKAALSFKKSGNIEKAKEMLGVAKSIAKAIQEANSGLLFTDYVLPSEPPSVEPSQQNSNSFLVTSPAATIPTSPVSKNQISQSTVEPQDSTATSQLLLHLIQQLDSQMSLCTKLSAQYFTSNQKDLALEYHKRKKGLSQDKDTLLKMKDLPLDPNALPFIFSYTTLEYTIALSHADISLDQMEIAIVKGIDFNGDTETCVAFDIGWPFNASGTLSEGKGCTANIKGTNPGTIYFHLIQNTNSNNL